ncbi:MAG: AbrB/MazE/SpoVT family DNA-binding domain-containing protein [Anaerosomatales bacterium]|nr:AbrB/MazE/SpoVT family DNA-binding domain-containing protein [Coriobacteriia bacterium]
MRVTVSSKGQIVLPADIRRKYCLSAGTRLQLVDLGGQISLVPAMDDAVLESFGMLEDGPSTADLERARREDRRREDRTRQKDAGR